MRKYERILVATDFSPGSEAAVGTGIEFAGLYGAELVFLTVVEHFPDHLPHYRIAHEDKDPQHFITDRAEKELAALCERLGCPDALREVRVTAHSAKTEIVKFAADRSVDLIVCGKGAHGVFEFLSGSTATGVVRAAQCDVFVVHGGGKAQ